MIEAGIRERIMKNQKSGNESKITLAELLKEVSQGELCDFIVKHARNNPQFKNTVLLEFTHKIKKKDTNNINNYNQLLQNALDELSFDYEDIEYGHYDDILEIDVLDQWLNKAQEYADQNNPQEALLICKACIEEYATWCEKQDRDIVDYFDISYQETPFDVLDQIHPMQGIDRNELLNYCKSEILKPKYKRSGMYDGISNLLMNLSVETGSDDFITIQDKLLQDIGEQSSYEAKIILQRKIDFYRSNKQPDKVWEVIGNNLQIESFRAELSKKFIAENKLQEAKKLVNDFISEKENGGSYLYSWYGLKLQIAQKENDIPEIRRISFMFIESGYKSEYYNIYKSTFAKEEWAEKAEKLIKHYEKRHNSNWFNSSVADVLQAEKQKERLMKYTEKHLNISDLERYHTGFSSAFPEKTLVLFRQAIDKYAQNTGREIYEYIVKLFEKMVKIKGGNELVREMISQYRIIYKNRKAMMEILNKFK
jgi:hypothetical protein